MTKNKNPPSASSDLKPDGSPSCFHTGPPDASKITTAGHDYYSSTHILYPLELRGHLSI